MLPSGIKEKEVNKPYIHPNCPRRLAAAYHFARNARGEGFKIHILAEQRGINVRYLYNLIVKGIEPNDTTEKLRAVRKAMFLPARKRKARAVIAEKRDVIIPEHVRWWRELPKSTRDKIIQAEHAGYIYELENRP